MFAITNNFKPPLELGPEKNRRQEKLHLSCDHLELKAKSIYDIEASREKASSEATF